MKLYKTKKNCGKLLLGILAFCTGMILLTGCGSSSEQKQNKNEETAEENKEEDKVQIGLTVDSFVNRKMDPRQRCICGDCQRTGSRGKCAGCRCRCQRADQSD